MPPKKARVSYFVIEEIGWEGYRISFISVKMRELFGGA